MTHIDASAAHAAHSTRLARRGAGLLLLLALLALLLAGRAARAQAPAAGGAPSVGAALNPDGTLRQGPAASFDAKGYRMTLDPQTGGPVFRTAGAGDENWQDGFTLSGANNTVNAIARADNGDIYIGGSFTAIGDVLANYIARWNGTAWSGLGNGAAPGTATNNGPNSNVNALAVMGTDLYVGGFFNSVRTGSSSLAANRVAKWSGTAWSVLGSAASNGVNSNVYALAALGSDLYVGGNFSSASSPSGTVLAASVAKWNGTAWSALGNGPDAATTTNNGVDSQVNALVALGNDLYVGGFFTNARNGSSGTVPASYIAKWSGTAWSTLGNGTNAATTTNNGLNQIVYALAAAGTDLYVGGSFTSARSSSSTLSASYVAKWNGSAWSALGSGVSSQVSALAVLGTDLYVGGYFTMAYSASGGVAANRVAKWSGTAWSALGNGSNAATATNNGPSSNVTALLATGTDVYVGGEFNSVNSSSGPLVANRIARWNGTAWNTVATGLNGVGGGSVFALARAANGDIYVGGQFTSVGPVAAQRIAKWNGTAWSALGNGTAPANSTNNGVNSDVSALVVMGTDLYVGGSFFSASSASGAVAANYIAKWNGTAWSALGNGAATANGNNNGVDNTVKALAVWNNELYVGGFLITTARNGSSTVLANNIAKWNGTAWSALGNGPDAATATNNGTSSVVETIAVFGNELYVGGQFTSARNGSSTVPANRLAKWNGTAWSTLGNGNDAATATNNGLSGIVYALAVVGPDLYVGGSFTSASAASGAVLANRVAKWNGTAWSALGNGAATATASNNGLNQVVLAMTVLGTDLYVAGAFTSASTTSGATTVNKVVRWNGTAWGTLGTGLNSTPRSLLGANGQVVAGGDFSTVGDGSKITMGFGVYTSPNPTLIAVVPNPGGLGQAVTLTGTNLASPTALTINGANALAGIISNNGTSLVVRVPTTAAASGNVVITTANGTASAPFTVLAPPGNALAFDGVDDDLTTAATAPAFGTGSLTLEAWVRTSTASTSVFVAVGCVGGNDYWLGMNNQRAAVSISGGAAVGTSLINDGRWHHLAGVRNGTQLTIYVDGVAQTTVANANAASPAAPLRIGSFGSFGSSYLWPGSLDEVHLWNVARVPTLASRTTPALGTEPGLVLAYNFDQGTPATASTGANAGLTTLYDLVSAQPATLNNFSLASGNTASNYVQSYALVLPTVTTSTARTATGFTVNWTAPAYGTATSYLLDVSTTPTFSAPIAGSPFATTATSYALTGLSSSSAYYYRVRALNSALAQPDQGAYSNTVSQTSPLPVELTAFTATLAGPAAVRQAWATASEKNSRAFEVERSIDGVRFVRIGTVAAAGNSSTARTYELLDAKLPTGTATLYYRLRQVDADGTFSYSPVRTVALPGTTLTGAAAGLALYPNPARDRASTLTGVLPGAAVTVTDALGRPVASATADAVGTAALALPAGTPAGVYVVRAGSQAVKLTVE